MNTGIRYVRISFFFQWVFFHSMPRESSYPTECDTKRGNIKAHHPISTFYYFIWLKFNEFHLGEIKCLHVFKQKVFQWCLQLIETKESNNVKWKTSPFEHLSYTLRMSSIISIIWIVVVYIYYELSTLRWHELWLVSSNRVNLSAAAH